MAAFFLTMSLFASPCRLFQRTGVAWALALAGASLPGAQEAKPDQVLWRNARGQMNTILGVVSENSLTEVVIETGSSQRKIEALSVERVTFGAVPPAYAEGLTYSERGDHENAASKFSLAAGDASTRAVVGDDARFAAAQAWLRRAGTDPNALGSSLKECEAFLSEYGQNRAAPQARLLLGRLQRLSGETSKAAETLAALYREGTAGTAGYPPLICFRAGLAAGEAYLAGKDAAKAREIYLGLDGAIGTALANLPSADATRPQYLAIQSEARLGEGYCLLASGSVSQARTFFQGQVTNSEGSAARRFGAQLGLGEALLSEGNARAAQLEFAQVSAIDHSNKDRTARALVGLAESALKLQAKADAKLWVELVLAQHGDTPAVLKARELQKSL